MILPVWPILVAAAIVAVIVMSRQARRRRLEQLRASWGGASPRVHRMEEIARSHRSRVAVRTEPLALDDRTWDDLVLDDVFQRIDHTESTLGRHALYHRLRMAHTAASLRVFESLITRLSVDAPSRERAQLALGRLRDVHGYDVWWLGNPGTVDVPAWYVVFPVLTLATVSLFAGALARHDLLPALIAVLGLSFALNIAALKRVGTVSTAFRQIAPLVATGQALRFLQGEDIDPLVAPLRRETRSLLRLKTISRWVSGDPLMLSVQSNLAATMLSDFMSVVYDYANVVLPLNSAGVYLGIARLRIDAPKLLDVVAAIGDVDAALSVASLRAGHPRWTRPNFLPASGSVVVMTEAIHPLVADAVPNSVEVRPGTGMLVTGSNMSGKSTFLRTLGVTTVMAQSLHTCFADAYTAPMLVVRSCIGRADDLLAGKSYYLVEVEALLELVQLSASPMPHLFLLDEMFRGTNAVERIAAGQSVLIELVHDAKPHMVVAATHDNELVDLLSGPYAPFHFGDALTDETLTFDYHLRPGRATSRNAIALLRLNGAPPALVERALISAAELDRQRARES